MLFRSLAITLTGSGKTNYYIMYILVVLAVIDNPSLFDRERFIDSGRSSHMRVIIVALVTWEKYLGDDAMVPLMIFKSRSM